MYEQFAGVYDRLMDDFDYDAWADYYMELLRRHGCIPQTACECGCGTGSLSVRFARRGIRLTASDISDDMLRAAEDKARRNGVRIPFVRQDMRAIQLHRPVDAVLCCCDGVNYLTSAEDVRAFFRAAYKILKPGGKLAFDISSRYKLRNRLGNAFFGEERDDVAYLWQNTFREETQTVLMDLTFFVRQSGGLYARFTEQHIQRAHTLDEILKWLAECGFEDTTAYGDCVFSSPVAECERIHFIAGRPAEEQKQ